MNAPPTFRLIAAAGFLFIYLLIAATLLYLLYNLGERSPEWNQVLVRFAAVGALATTAAGVLLGVDIQQANVDRAQQSVEQSAALVARKNGAILEALGWLDAPATTANDGSSTVRSVLQAGLAIGR